jgi:hypothetical protein
MAKKKVIKKKIIRKKSVKKAIKKKVVKKPVKKVVSKSKKFVRSNVRKLKIVINNLIFFIILFVLSLILYSVSGEEMYINLFLMLSIIFGFVSLAFLISLLVLLFLKIMRR